MMQQAEENRRLGERTIVFVDEIHRFNKAQQDAFLPFVEKGSIILIGATTENPSFEVNGALLSRCKVFVLQALSDGGPGGAAAAGADGRAGLWRQQVVHIAPEAAGGHRRLCQRRRAHAPCRRWRWSCSTASMDGERRSPSPRRRWTSASRKQIPALRQERRGALQPHLRAAQVHAQFRPGRGGLLAGAHAGGRARTRSTWPGGVVRFASEDVGLADPPRAGARRGRLPGLPLHRHARVHGAPDPGGGLPLARAQVQRPVRRLRDAPRRTR